MKPYHEQDGITIYNGDNCDVLGQLPRECVDLVVTSPPYDDLRTYGGHSWDFYGVAWLLKRVLKPGGVIVWIVDDTTKDGDESGSSWSQASHFKRLGLKLWDTMIWNKTNGAPGDGKYRYHNTWEYMFVISKGVPKSRNLLRDVPSDRGGEVKTKSWDRRRDESNVPAKRSQWVSHDLVIRRNIWSLTNGSNDRDLTSLDHPAVFPQQLARDHILSWSNEGDTVLDPFSGSGTTVKMARDTGRKGIGIEVNQEYCDITVKRLSQRVFDFSA